MSHTYSSLFFHVVWSTKNRTTAIEKSFQEQLYRYICGIVKRKEGRLLSIGGTSDHIHLLINVSPKYTISDVVCSIKSNSSRFIKQNSDCLSKFAWQEGYGAFSVSVSALEKVSQYICNQESHHKKYSFEQEFLELLKKHNIEYDAKYLFG